MNKEKHSLADETTYGLTPFVKQTLHLGAPHDLEQSDPTRLPGNAPQHPYAA